MTVKKAFYFGCFRCFYLNLFLFSFLEFKLNYHDKIKRINLSFAVRLMVGIVERYLTVERNKQLYVKLYPEVSSLTREQPPIASFIIKLISSSPNRRTLIHPGPPPLPLSLSFSFLLSKVSIYLFEVLDIAISASRFLEDNRA